MSDYKLIEEKFIDELDTNAKFYVHPNTGAEILFYQIMMITNVLELL